MTPSAKTSQGVNQQNFKGSNKLWPQGASTLGFSNRAKETIDALFSPGMWTDNGLLSQSGDSTYFDRAALYALKGVFMSGDTRRGLEFLTKYSTTRLLGDHVPYPIEAWPEGNQRHMSAEDALYQKIFIEGIIGLRPTGLNSFKLTPMLPDEWPSVELSHIRAFGDDLDIRLSRQPDGSVLTTVTTCDGKMVSGQLRKGESMDVSLDRKEIR